MKMIRPLGGSSIECWLRASGPKVKSGVAFSSPSGDGGVGDINFCDRLGVRRQVWLLQLTAGGWWTGGR